MDLNFLNAKTLSMKEGGNKIKIKSISRGKKLRLEFLIQYCMRKPENDQDNNSRSCQIHQSRQKPAFHWPKTAILASKG